MIDKKYSKYIVTELKKEVREQEEKVEPSKRLMEHVIWMDNEVLPGAFYSECVWFRPGPLTSPEELRKRTGLPEHTHPWDEVLAYFGTDPNDPQDLGGEIEFWLGDEQFNLTKSFLVYIPAGIKHCPLKHIRIDRPIFHFTMGPGRMYEKDKQDNFTPQNNINEIEGEREGTVEKNNAKYFVFQDKPDLKLPGFRQMLPREIAYRILQLDSEVVPGANFYVEAVWYWPKPEQQSGDKSRVEVQAHTHDFDEFIGFFGTDPDDIHDLCGEIELWIDGEQNIIDKSFLAFVPAGVEHCPLNIRRVDRPIFHFTAGPGRVYG